MQLQSVYFIVSSVVYDQQFTFTLINAVITRSARNFSFSPLALDTNQIRGSRNDWALFYIVCACWAGLEAQVR